MDEQCIRQLALTVAKNVKFPSSLMEPDQCTAVNVILNEDPPEEVDIKLTR